MVKIQQNGAKVFSLLLFLLYVQNLDRRTLRTAYVGICVWWVTCDGGELHGRPCGPRVYCFVYCLLYKYRWGATRAAAWTTCSLFCILSRVGVGGKPRGRPRGPRVRGRPAGGWPRARGTPEEALPALPRQPSARYDVLICFTVISQARYSLIKTSLR